MLTILQVMAMISTQIIRPINNVKYNERQRECPPRDPVNEHGVVVLSRRLTPVRLTAWVGLQSDIHTIRIWNIDQSMTDHKWHKWGHLSTSHWRLPITCITCRFAIIVRRIHYLNIGRSIVESMAPSDHWTHITHILELALIVFYPSLHW